MVLKKNSPEVTFVKRMFKDHGISYRINWNPKQCCPYYYGTAIAPNKVIINTYEPVRQIIGKNGYDRVLKKRTNVQTFLSTAFHELQHILMYRRGAYKEYHGGIKLPVTNKFFTIWSRQYLKAERMADKLAAKMMKLYFPDLKYKANYAGEIGRRMVEQAINSLREIRK